MKRFLLVLLGLVVLVAILGFWVLPPIVKAQAQSRLSAMLGRRVTIAQVRINPFSATAAIDGFSVAEADGVTTALSWRRLQVHYEVSSLLRGYYGLGLVRLEAPYAHVGLDAKGSLNFADVIAKLTAPASPSPAPAGTPKAVQVGLLQIVDAKVDYDDLARKSPFHTTIGPVSFVLSGFRTMNGPDSPYDFAAVSESGEKFAWKGTLAAEPVRSSGTFLVENLVLKKYAPYYADSFLGQIKDGQLSVRGGYTVDLGKAHPVMTLQDGRVDLQRFILADPKSGETLANLPSVTVDGISADAFALSASVKSIVVAAGKLALSRDANGQINLLALLPPPSTAPSAAPQPKAIKATIGSIDVHEFALDWKDAAAPRPASLGLTQVEVSLKDLSLEPRASFPLSASFTLAQGGSVSLKGSVGYQPVKAKLDLDVKALQLLPFSPYAEQFVNARLTQGSLSTRLSIAAEVPDSGPPTGDVTGDLSIDQFATVDSTHLKDLAGFESLALSGIRAHAGSHPSVSLARVSLSKPSVQVFLLKDGSINLLGLAKAQPGLATPTAKGALPQIEVGGIAIDQGEFGYTDLSIEPRVRMAIDQFTGTIGAVSSAAPAKARVDIQARVDGTAPVTISGTLDPLGTPRSVDLSLKFKGIDLIPLSAYSGRYAGYELARGRLTLDIQAKLDDKSVSLDDAIRLDQFTFGASSDSAVATKLPVRLGVALLKDINGQILINVPVRGSLDNPDFRIRDQVLRVVVNLLTKAAVSPFSLVGSMFGGGGEELAHDEFEPGASVLTEVDLARLATIEKALNGRPALSLSITGSYDPAADTYALKQKKLANLVRRKIWESLRASDPNIAPPDKLVITDGQTQAMVKTLFDETFPPGTTFGTPIPQKPDVTPPPAPPRPGIVRRVVDAVTFKGYRAERAERKEEAKADKDYQAQKEAALAAGTPFADEYARLADSMHVSGDDLRELAGSRAAAVRDHLIEDGKISAERLFVALPTNPATLGRGPRVFLELQ